MYELANTPLRHEPLVHGVVRPRRGFARRGVGELDAELVVDGPFEVGFGALENADDVFEPGDEGADFGGV